MSGPFMSADGDEVASASAASQLKQLNLDYLRLLILEWREAPAVCTQTSLPTLSAEWLAGLAAADEPALSQLAGSRFSLFTLVFHRAELWQRMVSVGIADEVEQRYGDSGRQTAEADSQAFNARRSGFIECALFYAWHLGHCDRAAARLYLGLHDKTAEILLRLELWQLRRVALRYPQLLAPRWPANACFWPDLLRYVHTGDRQYLDYAGLLGTQLLAQELEPSAIERLTKRRKNLFKPESRRR